MKQFEHIKAEAIFRQALQGVSYSTIAAEHGITRGAVERRVKRLAERLQTVVGVVGVEGPGAPALEYMRINREHYFEALDHYVPEKVLPEKRPSPTDEEIDAMLERIRLHRRTWERDQALLLILLATAAKPHEISKLRVSDYLDLSGAVRSASTVRAAIAGNGMARPLDLSCARMVAAVDRYLALRKSRGLGIGVDGRFRGLDPDSRLFLDTCGNALDASKSRGIQVQGIYRKIFEYGGIRGLTASSSRRNAATRMDSAGMPIQKIASVLGLKNNTSVRRLLPDPARRANPITPSTPA